MEILRKEKKKKDVECVALLICFALLKRAKLPVPVNSSCLALELC